MHGGVVEDVRELRVATGACIKRAIEAANLDQDKVALALGVAQATVSRWTKGAIPEWERLRPLARVVQSSPVELLLPLLNDSFDVDVSVESAIGADAGLSREAKSALLEVYRTMRRLPSGGTD